MTLEIASFIFGGLLIFIGLLGGGFEVKELKVPQIKWPTRLISTVVGFFFIALGISLATGNQREDGSSPLPKQSGMVHFTIFDALEPHYIASGQSEQAVIRIDGNRVGMLTVNKDFPRSELTVTVANEGQHSFAIEATAFFPIESELTEVNCYGTGMIDVAAGSLFLFEARYDAGGPCLAWLEKR
jgi:hypothetical protein